MSIFPDTWEAALFCDVAEVFLGKTPSAKAYKDAGPVKVIKFRDVTTKGKIDFSVSKAGYVDQATFETHKLVKAHPGDVLITASAHSPEHIGRKVARLELLPEEVEQACIVGELLVLRAFPGVLPKWLEYFIRSDEGYREIQSQVYGMHLVASRAQQLKLPIASENEQRRIVAKLDALFEKSRSIREKLERLPRLLANLQKSILNSAFRGDLTKEWRANNPNVEPASELLKRIRAERRAKWEADLIAKGKAPKKVKYVEPEPVNAEGLPELPEGWCWASGAELFIWGSGDFLPKSQQEDGDFPVYGGNGVAGSHSSGNVDHIALVIGRVGANCGNAHLTCGAAWITDNAIFSRWSAPSLNLGFAQIFLSLHDIRSQAQGGGQPFVSQGTLNSIAIPVPPLSEQKEILSSASASMDRLSALSGLINTTQEKITSYETSSLAKAFRGELVPQDPNDEPASVLLERIRAQKPAAGTKRGRGRKTAA